MKLASVVAWFAVSAVAVLLAEAGAGSGPNPGVQVSQTPPWAPDLVLTGGRVYTLDPARPWAEAVAVRGDRIVGVGTSAEMRRAAGSSTRVIDLKVAFVSPGFNDGHVHAIGDEAVRILLDVYERVLTQEKLLGAYAFRTLKNAGAVCCTRSPEARWCTNGASLLRRSERFGSAHSA
jgi:hypothetical protein